MRTFFSGCSGLGSIFHIFPLTVNQRPETVTLLPLGLVYVFFCFLCKVSMSTFEAKELMSFGKNGFMVITLTVIYPVV